MEINEFLPFLFLVPRCGAEEIDLTAFTQRFYNRRGEVGHHDFGVGMSLFKKSDHGFGVFVFSGRAMEPDRSHFGGGIEPGFNFVLRFS